MVSNSEILAGLFVVLVYIIIACAFVRYAITKLGSHDKDTEDA